MSKRRVVVTGMGIISPVGNDLTTAWERVLLMADPVATHSYCTPRSTTRSNSRTCSWPLR